MSSDEARAGDAGEIDERSARRAALMEINGRRVNEAIDRGSGGRGRLAFVCECGRIGCTTLIELSREAYDAVRTDFNRFLLVPGHEMDGIDEVVERHDGYLVVEKFGVAAQVVEDIDPTGA